MNISKESLTEAKSFIQAAYSGAKDLVEAVSIMTVTSYTVYGITHFKNLPVLAERLILAAAFVIGLRGAWEFVRYLARKGTVKKEVRGRS